jgi:hypothetical protein
MACNKDENPSSSKRLDFTTSTLSAGYSVYTYNTARQIIGYETDNYNSTITDNGNELHLLVFNKTENRTVVDGVYALNAEGNVISGVIAFTDNINDPYTSNIAYEYNNNGFMVKRTDVRSNGNTYTSDLIWTNGDLTSIIWTKNGSPYVTDFFEYNTGTADKLGITQDLFYMPMNDFVGKVNKHLPKRSYTLVAPSTTPATDYTYTFDLNSDGYPSTLTLDNTVNSYHEVISYHYQ